MYFILLLVLACSCLEKNNCCIGDSQIFFSLYFWLLYELVCIAMVIIDTFLSLSLLYYASYFKFLFELTTFKHFTIVNIIAKASAVCLVKNMK